MIMVFAISHMKVCHVAAEDRQLRVYAICSRNSALPCYKEPIMLSGNPVCKTAADRQVDIGSHR